MITKILYNININKSKSGQDEGGDYVNSIPFYQKRKGKKTASVLYRLNVKIHHHDTMKYFVYLAYL